jgi:hypothetical protein
MDKLRLIFFGKTDISSLHISSLFKEFFNLEAYSNMSVYNKTDCVFCVTNPSIFPGLPIVKQYLDQGFKLILANLWEARPYVLVEDFKDYLNNILLLVGSKNPHNLGWTNILAVDRWFWYNESLWYTGELNYPKEYYTPLRINNKLFLMPMKRQKPHRTQVRKKLSEFLNQANYSYVEAWENPKNLSTSNSLPIAPDRVFDPTWYNETYFSVVVETAVDISHSLEDELAGHRPQALPCDLFVTEKTYKPIAFQHPFIICGMQRTLQFLKDCGFETYDHIFDESYDNIESFDLRLDAIYKNIKNFSKEQYLDPQTENKIKHNHEHFYNTSRVIQGIKQDLINPILEWADAR